MLCFHYRFDKRALSGSLYGFTWANYFRYILLTAIMHAVFFWPTHMLRRARLCHINPFFFSIKQVFCCRWFRCSFSLRLLPSSCISKFFTWFSILFWLYSDQHWRSTTTCALVVLHDPLKILQFQWNVWQLSYCFTMHFLWEGHKST